MGTRKHLSRIRILFGRTKRVCVLDKVSDRALSRGRGAAVSDRSFSRGGVMANMGVACHVWLLSTRNVAGETEGKQFHCMELERI